MALPASDAAPDSDGLDLRVDSLELRHGVDEDLLGPARVEPPRGPRPPESDGHDVDPISEVAAELRLSALGLPPLEAEPPVPVPLLAVECRTPTGDLPPDPEGGPDRLRELGLLARLVLLFLLGLLGLFLLLLLLLRGLPRLLRGLALFLRGRLHRLLLWLLRGFLLQGFRFGLRLYGGRLGFRLLLGFRFLLGSLRGCLPRRSGLRRGFLRRGLRRSLC